MHPASREALSEATRDGRAKAEVLAAGLGSALGSSSTRPRAASPGPSRAASSSRMADVPIEAGAESVVASVVLTYELAAG